MSFETRQALLAPFQGEGQGVVVTIGLTTNEHPFCQNDRNA